MAAQHEPLPLAQEVLEVPIPGNPEEEGAADAALPGYRSSTLQPGESGMEPLVGLGGQAATPPGGDAVQSEVLRELMQRNPVVARVDGKDIRWVEVITSAGDLAIESEEEAEALFPALLERVIDLELLAAAARREGLHQEREVVANVRHFEDNVVRQIYVQRKVQAAVSSENLRRRYEDLIDLTGAKEQIHARHILVKTRQEAEGHIAALDDGADFAELARAHSIGPSAPRGGDLGYFDPSRMVPAFSRAALALTPGSYTRNPVETPFGWHVIELLDRRLEGLPPFEEMEAALREQAIREAMDQVLRRLRAESEIEIIADLPFASKGGPESGRPSAPATGSRN